MFVNFSLSLVKVATWTQFVKKLLPRQHNNRAIVMMEKQSKIIVLKSWRLLVDFFITYFTELYCVCQYFVLIGIRNLASGKILKNNGNKLFENYW